jgi:hypothetical protein
VRGQVKYVKQVIKETPYWSMIAVRKFGFVKPCQATIRHCYATTCLISTELLNEVTSRPPQNILFNSPFTPEEREAMIEHICVALGQTYATVPPVHQPTPSQAGHGMMTSALV